MESFVFKTKQEEPIQVQFDIGSAESNNSLYIEMYALTGDDPDPYADVTVDLMGNPPHYCAYIDVVGLPELAPFLEQNRIAYPTGLYKRGGNDEYPLYVFDTEALRRMNPKGLVGYERANGIGNMHEPRRGVR